MSDEKAPPNRTIQIDALTDVQLVDHHEELVVSRRPPPLPPRKPNLLVLALVVVVTGLLGAVAAHFLLPEVAPAPAPSAVDPPAEVIREVPLDEAFMIHAGSDPDAGLAPSP